MLKTCLSKAKSLSDRDSAFARTCGYALDELLDCRRLVAPPPIEHARFVSCDTVDLYQRRSEDPIFDRSERVAHSWLSHQPGKGRLRSIVMEAGEVRVELA